MEILFISHKYPPFTGGMEKQSFELITGMSKYATVHTIVYEGNGSKARFFLLLKRRIYNTLKLHPAIRIIHYNDGLIAAWCRNFSRYSHVKRTVTLHGLDVVFPNALFQRYILPSFNRFDLIIAVSNATANAAIQRGLSPNKVIAIANGVDASISAPAEDKAGYATHFQQQYGYDITHRKVVVAMGRAVRRKGFSWFIQQVLPLLDERVLFVMVGPFMRQETRGAKILSRLPAFLRKQFELVSGFPTDEGVIRNLLGKVELKNKVVHLGRLPFPEIVRLLGAADAFVMPNISVEGDMEGFGLVCLEACLCGATVFAARIDGITDAIHEPHNGYLLPSGDASAWAEALNEFMEVGSVDDVAIPNARAFTIAHFGWDKMVKQYYEYFCNISGGC